MLSIFSHLIGNQKAKQILTNLLLNQTLPHTILLHGIEGIGKSLFALAIAQHLVKKAKLEDPDIHILKPDLKSRLHSVASIRNLIQEAFLPPFESCVKIFIIDEAEKMLPVSSNALLKILEEPPHKTYFILLSSEPKLLPSTILSRCINIAFFSLSDEEMTHWINQNFQTTEANKYAILAEGSLSKASHLLNFPLSFSLDALLRASTYCEFSHLLSKIPEPLEQDTELYLNRVFEEILYWTRQNKPLKLQETIRLMQESHFAFHHHIKLKTILEHVYLTLTKT